MDDRRPVGNGCRKKKKGIKEKGWRRRLVSVFPDLEPEGTAFATCRRRVSRCSLPRLLLASTFTLVITRRLGTCIPGLGAIVSWLRCIRLDLASSFAAVVIIGGLGLGAIVSRVCGVGRSVRFAIFGHLELRVFKARERK